MQGDLDCFPVDLLPIELCSNRMSKYVLFKKDLSPEVFEMLSGATELAVDCEMMGLNPIRDRLCLVQIGMEKKGAWLVQIDEGTGAPLLKQLMENPAITKIFHFARMDIQFLKARLGVDVQNIFCTKIASRLGRTYTDRHGLKDLVREFTGENLDKSNQSSDWGKEELTKDQLTYAEGDVKYLFQLKRTLETMIEREDRKVLLDRLLEHLPVRRDLDLLGYGDVFEF